MFIPDKKQKWAVASYFGLLFSFLVIRAITVPLIPDEAFTYFLYVEPGNFLAPAAQADANNHLLNSVLSYLSASTFGHSTFALRIPNLLFFGLYFFAAYKLAQYKKSPTSFWIVLISLTTIYPILEFFSLSRGYGMSYALLLYAISLVFDFQKQRNPLTPWLILLITIAGLWSQLSLLFAFSMLLLICALILLREKEFSIRNKIGFSVSSVTTLFLFVLHIADMKKSGLLYFGSKHGFPITNLVSLNELLYQSKNKWLAYLIFVLILIALVSLIIFLLKFRVASLTRHEIVFPAILLGSVTGTVLSIYVLEGEGPLSRTALYFFLLLIGSFLFMSNQENGSARISTFIPIPLTVFTLCFINSKYVNYWAEHAVQKEIYQILSADKNPMKSVGGSDYLDRIFYAEHTIFGKGVPTTYHIQREHFAATDYLLLTQKDQKKYQNELKEYQLVVSDEQGVNLYQAKKTRTAAKIQSFTYTFQPGNYEFMGVGSLFSKEYDLKKDYCLLVETASKFPQKIADLTWVVSFFDQEGGAIETRYFTMNHFSRHWADGTPFSFSVPIPLIPENTDEVRLYLYNPKLQQHDPIKISYTLYQL